MSKIKIGDMVRPIRSYGYKDAIGLIIEEEDDNCSTIIWNNGIISYAWSEDMLARISDKQT